MLMHSNEVPSGVYQSGVGHSLPILVLCQIHTFKKHDKNLGLQRLLHLVISSLLETPFILSTQLHILHTLDPSYFSVL